MHIMQKRKNLAEACLWIAAGVFLHIGGISLIFAANNNFVPYEPHLFGYVGMGIIFIYLGCMLHIAIMRAWRKGWEHKQDCYN